MIISHSKKFLFVHNYKVAGTSVERALSKHNSRGPGKMSWRNRINHKIGIYPSIYSSGFRGHITAKQLRIELPQAIWNSYYKFGYVRNPWDRQVSLYTFMLNNKKHREHELAKGFKDFEEYLEWRIQEGNYKFQKDFFYDGDKCLVDFVGKYETLVEDFDKICKKLGITSKLGHANSSRNSRSFLEYYNEGTIDLVYNHFYVDVDLFGYEKPNINAS